jgi:L-ribulose-5-phosphate 4-epimerase
MISTVINQEFASQLAMSCTILAQEGQADMTLVHVSARVPGQDMIYMKPYALGLDEVKKEDIIVLDFEGNKLAGERRRHTEYPLHTEVYKSRPEVNCIVHTHPLYAVLLGATGGKLHPISHEGTLFLNLPLFTDTTELIRTPEQGKAVALCLGNARALLLKNHGVVVVGKSIEEATVYAILLEKAAKVEILTRGDSMLSWSSEEESLRKVEQIYHARAIQNYWDYYARRAGRHNPNGRQK